MALTSLCPEYPITIKKGATAHRYDVAIIWKTEKGAINLTETVDKVQQDRNFKIIAALQELKGIEFVYDKMRQLWTPQQLTQNICINRSVVEWPEISSMFRRGSLEITISANLQQPHLDLSEFSSEEFTILSQPEPTLKSVLDLIISYPAVRSGFVAVENGLYGAETPFERGLVYRFGCLIDVQFYQRDQNVQPVIRMDTQKKVFYPSGMNFLQALNDFGFDGTNYSDAARVFNGVRVQYELNPERIYEFKDFGNQNSNDVMVDSTRSLTEFLMVEHGTDLHHAKLPTARMKNTKHVFPLELLIILPGQDVSPSKLPTDLDDLQKTINIANRSVRNGELQQMFPLLEFDNPTIKAFGCSVGQNPLQSKFRSLPAANIAMPNDPEINPDPRNRSFRFGRGAEFVIPGSVINSAIIGEAESENGDLQTQLICLIKLQQDLTNLQIQKTKLEIDKLINN